MRKIVVSTRELARRLGVPHGHLHFEVMQVENVVRFDVLVDGRELTREQLAIVMGYIDELGELKFIGIGGEA